MHVPRYIFLGALVLAGGAFGLTSLQAEEKINGFASVEIGIAELSPRGEAGGYAVPASGSSRPSTPTYSCNPAGDQVTINWFAPSDPYGHSYHMQNNAYALRLDNKSDDWSCSNSNDICNDNYSGTSFTTSITPDQQYGFWVHSKLSNGWLGESSSVDFSCPSPTPPEAPVISYECSDQGNEVTITNSAVPSNSIYAIRFDDTTDPWTGSGSSASSPASGDYWNNDASSNATYAIQEGVEYSVWAHFINTSTNLWSAGSNGLGIKCERPAAPPTPMVECNNAGTEVTITVESASDTLSYPIRFDHPQDAWLGETGASSAASPAEGDYWSDLAPNVGTYTISPDTAYSVWVHYLGNDGVWSDAVGFSVNCPAPPPQPPQPEAICSPDGTGVTVNIEPSSEAANYAIVFDKNADSWTYDSSVTSPAGGDYGTDNANVTDTYSITPDTDYEVWVHYINSSDQWGAPSSVEAFNCPAPNICTGTIPPNATAFTGDDSGLTADTPWTYAATDTSTKCQYTCNAGYTWSGTSCDVTPVTYSCTGNLPTGATAFTGDDSGLTADTPWTYAATDTSTKCQYTCSTGYTWNGSSCVATPYSCTGTIPTGASAFDSEEETSLTANTAWTYAATDSSTKCQYTCSTGYTWNGSSCVASAQTNITATNFSHYYGTLEAGQTIYFRGTAYNNSSVTTGASSQDEFKYCWGSSCDVMNNGVVFGLQSTPVLSAGETWTNSEDFYLQQNGTLKVQYCIDASWQIDESDESYDDNCEVATYSVGTAGQPNLTAENLSLYFGTLQVGSTAYFRGTVRNNGSGSTGGSFVDEFQYCWGSSCDVANNGTFLGWSNQSALAAGSSQTDTSSGLSLTQSGTLRIQYCIDASWQIDESDESYDDNCEVSDFTVSAGNQTNLTAQNLVLYSGDLEEGENVRFRGTVNNDSSLSSGTYFYDEFRYCWGSSCNVGTGQIVSTHFQWTLGGGSSRTDTSSSLNLDQSGTLKIQYCVDSTIPDRVNEADESYDNNCEVSTFEVTTDAPAPTADVKVRNVTEGGSFQDGTLTIEDGQEVELSWSSTNASSCSGTNFSTGSGDTRNGTQSTVTEPTSPNSTNYTVACTGAGGTAYDVVTVTAEAGPGSCDPSISVDDSIVSPGDSINVSWDANCSGGDGGGGGGGGALANCVVTGPGINISPLTTETGNQSITIYSESTFVIDCRADKSGTPDPDTEPYDEITPKVLPRIQET